MRVLSHLIEGIGLVFRQRKSLEAEVLFLRRQLALYMERGVKPRRVDAATRMSLALLSRLFEWRSALVVVRPETLIRWHRAGFRLFWRWKSRPGRPPIPLELRQLIRRMARENTLWGQERIANELWVKLGFGSPRAPFGSIFPEHLRGARAGISAGRRSSRTMLRRSWRATSSSP